MVKITLVVHFKITEESDISLGASDEDLTSPNTNQLNENTFTEGESRLLGLILTVVTLQVGTYTIIH
jgi:hypothetical protein